MHRILVRRSGGSYSLLADNLHDPLELVVLTGAVSHQPIIDALWRGGWHQQDIGDALDEADRDWSENPANGSPYAAR